MAENEVDKGKIEEVKLDTVEDNDYVQLTKEQLAKMVGLSEEHFDVAPKVVVRAMKDYEEDTPLVNCLRNETVTVKYIDRPYMDIHDKKHVFYGGKAENVTDTLTTPVDRNGNLVNVLTKEEKKFLESYMGLQPGRLSVYAAHDNFWKKLAIPLRGRTNMVLHLSNPNDYIIYKTLLAHKMLVCPNMETLKTKPKATYRYVLVREGEEVTRENQHMNAAMKASMLLGSMNKDYEKLKYIVSALSGRAISDKTKIEFLQNRAFELMNNNVGAFIRLADDPYMDTKILLIKCVSKGIIASKDNYYFYEGKPLSHDGVDPTLDVAAQYINLPSNQNIKFALEARLNALKDKTE